MVLFWKILNLFPVLFQSGLDFSVDMIKKIVSMVFDFVSEFLETFFSCDKSSIWECLIFSEFWLYVRHQKFFDKLIQLVTKYMFNLKPLFVCHLGFFHLSWYKKVELWWSLKVDLHSKTFRTGLVIDFLLD